MIPKVIHYCWFGGGKLPELAVHCMASWKKYCPDYQIIRWDESNFDLEYNQYVKDAYKAKKWSLLTDVVRLKVIYDYGGIYLDTDVEIIRPFDDLLQNKAFMGIESTGGINTGSGYGAEKGLSLLKELLNGFESTTFCDTEPAIFSIMQKTMQRKGYIFNNKIQMIDNVTIYPMDYFAPVNLSTRKLHITLNTYSIHHYSGSWIDKDKKKSIAFRRMCCKLFGDKLGLRIDGHYNAIRSEGMINYLMKRIKIVRERN